MMELFLGTGKNWPIADQLSQKELRDAFWLQFLIVSKVGLANDCAINNLMRFLRRVRSLTPLIRLCY